MKLEKNLQLILIIYKILKTYYKLLHGEDLKNKNITEATDIYAFGCFKKWFIADIRLIKEV